MTINDYQEILDGSDHQKEKKMNQNLEEQKLEEKTIRLDGQVISQETLQERRKDKNIRIHQEGETSFRTLQKLQE